MEGADDPGCRGGMMWDEARHDARLLELHRRLARLRRTLPALREGTHRRLHAVDGVCAFVRESGGARVVVVANAGADAVTLAARQARDALEGAGRLVGTYGYGEAKASLVRGGLRMPPGSLAVVARRDRRAVGHGGPRSAAATQGDAR